MFLAGHASAVPRLSTPDPKPAVLRGHKLRAQRVFETHVDQPPQRWPGESPQEAEQLPRKDAHTWARHKNHSESRSWAVQNEGLGKSASTILHAKKLGNELLSQRLGQILV